MIDLDKIAERERVPKNARDWAIVISIPERDALVRLARIGLAAVDAEDRRRDHFEHRPAMPGDPCPECVRLIDLKNRRDDLIDAYLAETAKNG